MVGITLFSLGAFIIGALFMADFRFNGAKIITKIANKLF